MKDFVVARVYFLGWSLIRRLPETKAYALFDWLGQRMFKKNGKSVKRLRSNLSRVNPSMTLNEINQLTFRGVGSYMRYWCETFRSPDWDRERVLSSVSVTNEHLLMEPIRSGTSVVVALPHAGNWDHAGSYFCIQGARLVTVAEVLKPRALFDKFLEYRQKIGMEVLALDSQAFPALLDRARQGALIALVADRDLSRSGIDVSFFGGTARMPAGPALLALRTQTPLVTAFVSYTPRGIHIQLEPIQIPLEGSEEDKVKTIVQRCADNFASGITKSPQDWHMMQRIWIDDDFVSKL